MVIMLSLKRWRKFDALKEKTGKSILFLGVSLFDDDQEPKIKTSKTLLQA